MSVRCDAFAPDYPSFPFAEGHGAGVLPATSALRSLFMATILVLFSVLRSLFTATILVWFPSFLDLFVSSIATFPRKMKIYIEK